VNDINLINAIKSLLKYANLQEHNSIDSDIPEAHQNIVRKRIEKYEQTPGKYMKWEDIENKIAYLKLSFQ
jgi:hypothetical protein